MEYFQMIMALLGVLALVFLLFWAMKKLNRRVTLRDSKNMKILERINLGPDKMLLLVSVCGKCMVLGVTNGRVEKVHELVTAAGLNTTNDEVHFLPFWENGVKFFTIEGPNKEKVEFSQYL